MLVCRFFRDDEEMLILTHDDDRSRAPVEESRLPITNKYNGGGGDARPTEDDNPRPAQRRDIPAFRETRATVVSSGPGAVTRTSVVSSADSRPFTSGRARGKRRRSDGELEPMSNQRQRSKRRPYRLARLQGGRKRTSGQEVPRLHASPEGCRAGMSGLNPAQSAEDLNPTASITAWEAGWNVTNAIQVRQKTGEKRTFRSKV